MSWSIAGAHRLVVKIGSSSLTRADGGLDLNRIDQVARLAALWCTAGRQMLIVSSGAVAAGLEPLGFRRPPRDLASRQACAAMGQGLLVARWSNAFQAHHRHVAQVLLTTSDVMRREHYTNAQQALHKLLSLGVVPVINENDTVASGELRFGDNDRLAAYVAQMVAADGLVLLSDVEGLYTAPPNTPGAKLITHVDCADDLDGMVVTQSGSAVGTGGMATKVQASLMATSSGVGVVLTSADNLARILEGERVGTWFDPSRNRPASRTLWIAHAAPSKGEVIVDQGAAQALIRGGKSLLAAGIVQVDGHFNAGDVVDISYDSALIARGICAYDAATVAQIAGLSAAQMAARGLPLQRPVVHRDDMAMLV